MHPSGKKGKKIDVNGDNSGGKRPSPSNARNEPKTLKKQKEKKSKPGATAALP